MPSVPFDAIAAGYDRAMARVSEPFVPDLLAACALDAGDFFLDVGTGTGLVAAAAASAMGAAARVVGLDVSPAMLARARDRPRRSVWPSSRTMSGPPVPGPELRRRRWPLRSRLPGSPRVGGR
jgi:ubiquinone/menaquinone biosynthesis C-methylase UbiE